MNAEGTSTASGRETALIAVVGVLAGFLSGLFGVGGGLLIVPGLVLVARMDQRLAHGTSLAAVLPISASSMVAFAVHDNIDWPVTALLVLGAVAGAVLGTTWLHTVRHRTLALGFAVLLVVSAIRLFIPLEADGRGSLTPVAAVVLVAVGLAAGTLAGLLGVGGGIVMVPAMILLFGIPPVVAKGTSLAVIVPTALMGTWRNRRSANADLRAAAVLGGAGVVTAYLGGVVADRMSPTVSNLLFSVLLIVVAARKLWQVRSEDRDSTAARSEVVE